MNESVRILAVIFFAFGAGTPVTAQWTEVRSGEPSIAADSRNRVGTTSAMVALTLNPETFLQSWSNTPYEEIPRLETASDARRGDSITVLVFFAGCADEGSTCNALIDFRIQRPDGTIYAEHSDAPAWHHPAARAEAVMLSNARLVIGIEPTDPLGTYTVNATFRIPDRGISLKLSEDFLVSE